MAQAISPEGASDQPTNEIERLRVVEGTSRGTLPTAVVSSLSSSQLDDKDLARFARQVTRRTSQPLQQFFVPVPSRLRQEGSAHPLLVDRQTGRLVTFEDARRLYKVYKRENVQALFPQLGADPRRVAAVFASLGTMKGGNADFAPLLAVARDIANSTTDVYKLRANLEVIAKAKGLFPGEGVSPLHALLIAKKATEEGVKFTAIEDVLVYVNPDVAPAVQAQREARKRMEESPAFQQLKQYGDPSSPDFMPDSDFARQWSALMERGDLYASSMFGGDQIMSALLGAIGNDEKDYIAVGKKLVEQLEAERAGKDPLEQFRDPRNFAKAEGLEHLAWLALLPTFLFAWGAKAIEWTFDAVDWLWQRTGGVAEIALLGAGKALGNAAASIAGYETPSLSKQAENTWKDIRDVVMGRTTAAEEYAEDGIPGWVFFAADIGLSFVVAPDIMVGKWLRLRRAARLLPTAKSVDGWRLLGLSAYSTPERGLGGITIPEAFVRAASESETAAAATLRVNGLIRRVYNAPGAHPALVSTIFEYVQAGRRAGRTIEDLTDDVRELFYMSHGIMPSESNALAVRVREAFENARMAADAELPRLASLGASDELLNSQALAAVKVLEDYEGLIGRVGLLDLEIPKVANAAIRFGRRIGQSKFLDNELGRAARALLVNAPRRGPNEFYVSIDAPDLSRQVVSVARRSRVYSNNDLAEIELEVARFMDRGVALREAEFERWVKQFNDEMLQRLAKSAGADKVQTTKLVEMLNSRTTVRDRGASSLANELGGVFGVMPGRGPLGGMQVVDTPVFSTQLKNEFTILDPLVVRQGFNSVMGSYRQFRNFMLRTLDKDVPALAKGIAGINRSGEITDKTLRRAMEVTFDLLVRDLFLTWWKPLVVIRPAYVMRVVGIEEQARFIATRGLMERVRATKTGARLAKASEVRYGQRGLSLVFEAPPEMNVSAVKRLFEAEAGTIVEEIGEGSYRIFRPFDGAARVGEAAYADGTATAMALAGQSGPLRDAYRRVRGAAVDFKPLYRPTTEEFRVLKSPATSTAKAVKKARVKLDEYLAAWSHALTYQGGVDPIGGLIIRDIAAGVGREESASRVVETIMADKSGKGDLWGAVTRLVGRSEPSSAEIEDAVERMFTWLDEYTMGRNAGIAKHAMSGGMSVESLRKMVMESTFDLNLLPQFLHGPELELASSADGPIKRAFSAYSNMILRAPTNLFSRRPYARSWENAFKDAAYTLHSSQGRVLTPEIKAGIDRQAQVFARTQVERIMFDYTRQARLGEALDWLFPFMQPYMEQYQVWGRILKQNPAVVGYVRSIYKAGIDSGLITEDETGQKIIPLSQWLGQGALLNWFYGQPGWSLSAPASNVQFFLQTTLPIRLNGQEFGLPVPGVGVNVQWLFQKFLTSDLANKLDPEIAASLAGYVMRYGPITPESVLPPYIRNFVSGVSGKLGAPVLQEDTANRYAAGFLRNYAQQQFTLKDGRTVGLTVDNLYRYPDLAEAVAGQEFKTPEAAQEWLMNRAKRDVASLFLWRTFMVMFFPAAPMVEFPAAAWESELRALKDDPQYEGDYSALQEEWLRRHPDGAVYLISKTISDDLQMGGLQPLPSNERAVRLLQGKGAKEFAAKYPGWTWAIIPQELREQNDIGSFMTNLATGLLRTRPIEETLQLVSERQGWNEFYAIKRIWQAWQDANPEAGPNDPTYEINRSTLFDKPLDALRARNPWFGAAYDTWESQGINYEIIDQAHVLAKDKLFSQTQLGKALNEFLPEFDRIREELSDNAIANITDKSAETLGLKDDWDDLLTDLKDRYPDFALWVNLYDIDEAFTNVDSSTNDYLMTLPESQIAEIEGDWKKYEGIIGLPGELLDDVGERSEAYNERAPFVNEMYSRYDEGKTPLHLWWGNLTPTTRLSYQQTWSQYPVQWLDRFQKEQLGITSDDATEKTFDSYNRAVTQIEEQYALGEIDRSTRSALYASLREQMVGFEKKNPVLARQVAIANTWGFRFFAANKTLLNPDNPAVEEWLLLKQASQTIMVATYGADIYGKDDYNDASRAWYNNTYRALINYVQTELYDNPIFKQQWDQYVEAYGGSELMRQFMPEFTGRFGSGTYLTNWP